MQKSLNLNLSKVLTKYALPTLAGAIVGYLAWGNGYCCSVVSLSLFLIYLKAIKRVTIFLFALSYYLVSSRGLLIGAIHYYNEIKIALIVWLSAGVISTTIWVLIWHKKQRVRRYLLIVVILLITFPPIGFINWVNPLITAGAIFPKSGWIGFIFLLCLIYLINFNYFITILLIPIISLSCVNTKIEVDNNFSLVQTTFSKEDNNFQNRYFKLKKLISIINKSKKQFVILPENALGTLTNMDLILLGDINKSKTILAGATIPLSKKLNANVFISYKDGQIKTLYKQRVPVPISMWGNNTKAYLFANPVTKIQNKPTGIFICYEQLVAITYIHTMLNHPKLLIGISNLWWAKNTNIKTIQQENLQLWSLLFGVPCLWVGNGIK